jgi:hypothetical protein
LAFGRAFPDLRRTSTVALPDRSAFVSRLRDAEPVVMKAVEEELARRGFAKATTSPPDFNVTYYVLVTIGSVSQQMGQFLPAVTEWGLPPFTAQTTVIRVYPLGTLVLDISSGDPSRAVWRAVAQAEVDLDKTEAQRAVRIRSVVRDIVAKLPRTNRTLRRLSYRQRYHPRELQRGRLLRAHLRSLDRPGTSIDDFKI